MCKESFLCAGCDEDCDRIQHIRLYHKPRKRNGEVRIYGWKVIQPRLRHGEEYCHVCFLKDLHEDTKETLSHVS